MSRGEVLVAIVKSREDFVIVREQGWYRIPVRSVQKWLRGRWPPRYLAFYQPKTFGDEAYAVRYYAEVLDVRKVLRRELFPDRPDDPKADWAYYQIRLGPLKELPKPIHSKRFRRIVFIPTTWEKFTRAEEINDLFDESPLEDQLWSELKRLNIPAERQEHVDVNSRAYFLDFAILLYARQSGRGDGWRHLAR